MMTSQDDALFDEMKSLWQEQACRVDGIVAKAPSTTGLPRRPPSPCRRTQAAVSAAIALLYAVAAVGWFFVASPHVYTLRVFLLAAFVELALLAMMVLAGCHAVLFHRADPVRIGTVRMSRLQRCLRPQPHYLPQSAEPAALMSVSHFRRRAVAACAAVAFFAVTTACVPAADDYAICQSNQSPSMRLATIEVLDNTFRQS